MKHLELVLFTLLLSLPAAARVVIYEHPQTGEQMLVELLPESKIVAGTVLWDEKTDGKLKADLDKLGGFVRSGKTLEVDERKLARAKADKDSGRDKKNAKEQAKERLKSVNWSQVNTAQELKQVIKDLIDAKD